MTQSPDNSASSNEQNQLFVQQLDGVVHGLGLHAPSRLKTFARGPQTLVGDTTKVILRNDGGVLRWEILAPPSPGAMAVVKAVGTEPPAGNVVRQYEFENIPPSEIGRWLDEQDQKLTPSQGLLEVVRNTLTTGSNATPIDHGRILLLIHGTFSNCDHLLAEFASIARGREFIGNEVWSQYNQILAFNHSTLSVSPVLNAIDLSRCLQGTGATVDVICHSRGGLVTRWWREDIEHDARPGKVIFVGSPLAGTSLASPYRIRQAIGLLTNVCGCLAKASNVAGACMPIVEPVLAGVSILLNVVSSVSAFAANTPLVDAAIAAVPGLAAQARQGANGELLRLRSGLREAPAGYYAVQSNFQPTQPGWAFWRYFNDFKARAVDALADVVFNEPNDLVVDTCSMTDLLDGIQMPNDHLLDFGTNDRVHHINYFQQEETIRFIQERLFSA